MEFTELAFAFVTSMVGALGGLGGAVLLVPLLVLTGTSVKVAAPLGLVSVAAGSLSAGALQTRERLVNHRLGVTTELVASAGAVAGAIGSDLVSNSVLQKVLGAVAIASAVLGGRRKGIRNLPDPALVEADVGEHQGALSGVYSLKVRARRVSVPSAEGHEPAAPEVTSLVDAYVPYRARRLGWGLGLFGASGLLAGLSGVSGGFIKTPATSEVMHVPVRVAAATTTFTIGVTSATGLVVFAFLGRLDLHTIAAVVVGSVVGGQAGARIQSRLSPPQVRRFLSVVLILVGAILLVK